MGANESKITLRIEATDAYSAVLSSASNRFKGLADRGVEATDRLSRAFNALNIKSKLDIEKEKARAIAAFEAIRRSGVASADEIKRAHAAMQARVKQLDEAPQKLKGGLSGIVEMLAGVFAVERVIAFTRAAFEASLAIDSINSKLKVMTGSAAGAAQEWEFIRSEAQRLGLDLLQTADSYSSFAVAAKGTSMEGARTRATFTALAEAAAALHIPSEQLSRTMYQFQQMMAKGTVNMEDLKTASESGIISLKDVAAALGISTTELMKQMQSGQLMAAEVLPKIAEQLHKTYGKAAVEASEKGRGALNKFNTAVFELKAYLGQAVDGGPMLLFLGELVEKTKESIFLVQQAKIYWGAWVDKLIAFGKVGVSGLVWGGQEARDELKAEFEAIDAEAEYYLAKRLAQLESWSKKTRAVENKTSEDSFEDAARNSERRRKEAQKTGEDLAKINVEYAKQVGGYEAQITADLEKQYEERKKATTDFYNQKKAYAKDDMEEAAFEIIKNQKMLQIEAQHRRDIEIVQAMSRSRQLEGLKNQVELETILIQEKMAKGILTTEQGERRIEELTVASAKAQYDAKKAITDKYVEIYGRQGEDYKKLLKEQDDSHKNYLSVSLAAYRAHADNIKRIDQEIKDFRAGIQDKIRDIQQRGMTDGQKYADDQRRFEEALAKSREALAQKDYETALKYNKQAEDLAGRLVDKKAETNTRLEQLEQEHQQRLKDIQNQSAGGNLTEQQKQAAEVVKENAEYERKRADIMKEQAATQQGIATATAALNDVERQGVAIMEAKKRENQDALAKLKEIEAMKLDPKSLAVNMDQAALASVQSALDKLVEPATKVINVVYKSTGSSGEASYSDTPGYFEGGKIGVGSAMRDSVHALLAKNEWVINNRATGFWGDGFMAAINAPFSAAGLKLQQALNISTPAAATPVPMGTISLDIGGGSYPVQAPVNVLGELNTALRRLKMTRPQ